MKVETVERMSMVETVEFMKVETAEHMMVKGKVETVEFMKVKSM